MLLLQLPFIPDSGAEASQHPARLELVHKARWKLDHSCNAETARGFGTKILGLCKAAATRHCSGMLGLAKPLQKVRSSTLDRRSYDAAASRVISTSRLLTQTSMRTSAAPPPGPGMHMLALSPKMLCVCLRS